jgi:hypothetical protein
MTGGGGEARKERYASHRYPFKYAISSLNYLFSAIVFYQPTVN